LQLADKKRYQQRVHSNWGRGQREGKNPENKEKVKK